ncbi:YicC/YloC family endoribonuclease [Inquilinus sp. CAU 1745]|uniref:YicC/YloC family endoribonuclease n=1 Tax=Inquilinus sp. CAU 1745 TaxID=3140369 RepID=UPI00325BBA72
MDASSPALSSMTGFARVEGGEGALSWVWEARSVNGKALDLRCRLASGHERLEPVARAELARRFKRGNVTVSLTVARVAGASAYAINRPFLEEVLAVARSADPETPPRIDALLAVRGVVEPVTGDGEADAEASAGPIERDLRILLDRLAEARAEEGRRLASALGGHMEKIESLVAEAAATAAVQPEALKERLRTQVTALLDASPALSEERLAQEAALLILKADVREELDRLTAHIAQARQLLGSGEPSGRRLDFLCQEFNREANTLCSKSSDVALTRIGLDLKATIDQFREQVQNIE